MRPVDEILHDWREAEAQLPTDASTPDITLIERISYLRAEYAAAVDARDEEAEELGRAPGEALIVREEPAGA